MALPQLTPLQMHQLALLSQQLSQKNLTFQTPSYSMETAFPMFSPAPMFGLNQSPAAFPLTPQLTPRPSIVAPAPVPSMSMEQISVLLNAGNLLGSLMTPSPSISPEERSRVLAPASESAVETDSESELDVETVGELQCHWGDCCQKFKTKTEFYAHVNAHPQFSWSDKLWWCQWRSCPNAGMFRAHYQLVAHCRQHTKEKPYPCTMEGCDRAYGRKENLKTHVRVHTGEKPYVCVFPRCEKRFSNASDRAKHQNRTHSDSKPYVCLVMNCGHSYTDPSSLRKHVHNQHGEASYNSLKEMNKSLRINRRRAPVPKFAAKKTKGQTMPIAPIAVKPLPNAPFLNFMQSSIMRFHPAFQNI